MEFTSALPLIFLVYISLFYIVMTVSRVFLLMMDLKIKPDSVDEELESKKTKQAFSKISREPVKPTHNYNLRSRSRRKPKHRAAFDGLLEI